MRVQVSPSRTVFETNQVSVAHELDWIGALPTDDRFVEFLDKPLVVAVFVRVGRHLLLLGTDSRLGKASRKDLVSLIFKFKLPQGVRNS